MKKFEIKRNRRGEPYLKFTAANGKTIIPTESYKRKSGVLNLIRLIKESADATVYDEQGNEIELNMGEGKKCKLCGLVIRKGQRWTTDTQGNYSHHDCARDGFTMESGE